MAGRTRGKRRKGERRDIAQEITDRLIARLEEGGPLPWRRPWRSRTASIPLRSTGEAYRGVNHLLLSIEAHCSGYASPYWMTFRQACELGGCVRKGERSSMVVYYGTAPKKGEKPGDRDEGEDGGLYRFLKGYRVFSADQIDGLPERFHPTGEEIDTGVRSDGRLDDFFDRMPFTLSYGHEYAAYREGPDEIVMPDASRFESVGMLWGTACHEAVHATGVKDRLNRECFDRYHAEEDARASEELVAEVGAAMLTAHLGVEGEHIDNHAAYLKSWLRALRGDKRHIFKAAAEAQRACDWLLERGGSAVEAPSSKAA